MRIVVLGHGLLGAGATSVGKNLLRGFAQASTPHEFLTTIPNDPAFKAIVANNDQLDLLIAPRPNEFGRLRLLRRWQWERTSLRAALRDARPDILLGLADRGVLSSGCPQAIYLHRPHMFYPESQWRRFVSTADRWKIRYHCRQLQRLIAAEQPLLIAQTAAAAERIKQRFGYDRVIISPNSVSVDIAREAPGPPPAEIANAGARRKLLCLTRYYSHKNLEMLIELFQRCGDELRDVAIILTLDPQRDDAARFLKGVERAGVGGHFVNLGEVPQAQLASAFLSVDGVILPTLLESFSGVYGEAMAFGVPILTSDRDFARVLCGDAAEYFEPHDAASMSRAIRRVLDDPGRAAALVAVGKERLPLLSRPWDKIAAELLDEVERFAFEAKK